MRFSTVVAGVIAPCLVAATPLVKRASLDDAATVGYASTNGGTTGGSGGTTTTVSSYAAFTAAVSGDTAAVVVVSGTITAEGQTRVGSNKSIIGASGSSLVGNGLYIKDVSNVIVRNMKISKVLADYGDAIGIQAATNVWVDHCDLSSDRDHDKDYYDGLLDITHASDWVTVTYTYLHDHWKASLVGHSDSNGDEDTGHLTVTYALNYWYDINSRMPSYRFGTGHIFNSYFLDSSDGINTRDGAQLLVESCVFNNVSDPIYSTDSGYAVVTDCEFIDSGTNEALVGTLSSSDLPYSYTLIDVDSVESTVTGSAGQTLSF